MAKTTVRIYTTLKDRFNASRLTMEAGDVGELLNMLTRDRPDVRTVLFDEDGIVKNCFVLTLNSEILDHKQVGEHSLKEGDVLHIFPPVSGG